MIDIYFPLRIYDDESMTAPARAECQDLNHMEYFCTPLDYLPSFQVSYDVTEAALVDCRGDDTGLSISLHTDVITGIDGLSDSTRTTFSGGNIPAMEQGLYQLKLTIPMGGGVGLSDPIYFCDRDEIYDIYNYRPVSIRYRGTPGMMLGSMYFRSDLWARIWINSWVEKPEYPVLNETRQDGDAEEHIVFQRWEKRKRLRFKGVESMCDAMSLLPLMEEVWIGGERVYRVVVNVTWDDEYSCLGDIDIQYSTSVVTRSF